MQSIISSKKIAKNVGIFGGAQAFSVLAALVRNKVAAVAIGSAAVGLSSIYNTAVSFISTLSGLGLSFSGVKYISEIFAKDGQELLRLEVKKLRTIGMVCALAGFILTLLASPLLSKIYFQDFLHILPFTALSVFVFITILSGIELSILKACQKIRYMAISLIFAAVASVSISLPLYILKGIEGVFWAVLLSGIAESLLTFYFGNKTVRYSVSNIFHLIAFRKDSHHFASSVLPLGLAFLAGGVIASGADMAIQSFFSSVASVSVLGLYRAGYQLSITYTGMIFTAVGSDFYPRLSAVNTNIRLRNMLITRQIKVLLCITIPLVLIFIMIVPYLLPILFADTFTPICHMVQLASLSIIVKSITVPLNYMPLCLDKPKDYLLLEGAFWLLLIPLVIFGYKFFGLDGTGVAILLCHIIELIYVTIFCRVKYGLRFGSK